jgi:hypothetical protein
VKRFAAVRADGDGFPGFFTDHVKIERKRQTNYSIDLR